MNSLFVFFNVKNYSGELVNTMAPFSSDQITKYNTCAKICGIAMKKVIESLTLGQTVGVAELCQIGNQTIDDECSKIYKKEKFYKGVAFPTCVSLNNCVGYYTFENNNDKYNTVKNGDVVKIELGVAIDDCSAILGETIVYQGNDETMNSFEKYNTLLNTLKSSIPKFLQPEMTNDDIKVFIESTCTEHACFPVENTFSYQQVGEHLKSFESKYIVLNHQKYYDDDDNLIVDPDVCFDFEEGDVFHINLTIVPDHEQTQQSHVYVEPHGAHVMRYNEYFYNLKLKHSRDFCGNVKAKHKNYAFDINEYNGDIRSRIGVKESIENGILDTYPILYEKAELPVYHKKFTVLVKGQGKGMILKYT